MSLASALASGRPARLEAGLGLGRTLALGLWVLAGLAIGLAGNDPIERGLVLVAAWILLARRLVPGRHLRPLAVGVTLLGIITVVVNGLLSHTGSSILVTLPAWLPLVGGPVTVEGFAFGAGIALGLVAAVSVTAALSLVIEPTDLVDGLPTCLARTGTALGAALNLLPALATSFVTVRDTQRLRGWRARGVRGVADLVVPVLSGAIERSLQLGEAMEARAFGSGVHAGRHGTQRSPANLAVAAGSLVALGGFVALRAAGAIGVWYPYPTLGVPAFGVAALGPPVMLILAALLVPASAP
ncbi:MAG: CbiQ family ECF transporter T component [Acidimicrobiales bacterium]